MKPAAFEYRRVDDATQAVQILAHAGDEARILAGGQSLMPMLNMRLAQPACLIDISRSQALAQIRREANGFSIGAAVTQSQIEWDPVLMHELPLLALAIPHLAHFQIRNRGTVVGSIAHADPSAEMPLCLLTLEGDVELRSARRRRRVPAQAFFTGMLMTARQPDEMIVAVRFPARRDGVGYGFSEFSRRHGDFAICAVAAMADARRLRLAVAGVADRPVARDLPLLEGAALGDALNDFAWSLGARDEPQASAVLRRSLVRELGRRAADQAMGSRNAR